MSGIARVDSSDALKEFRTRLVKFAETAQVALADAEGEMQRMMVWLETEANTYWSGQIRKRHEAVEKCKDAVRQKQLFKSPTGSAQSAVEEEKQLRMAQKRLEEAEEKLKNVRKYTPRLQKEISIYKGGVQRLATTVGSDVPVAIGRLDRMVAAIEAYAAISVSGGGADDGGAGLFATMARALGDTGPAQPPPTDFKPMRQKTAAVERKDARPGDVRLETWSDGMITEGERALFGKITSDKNAPAPDLLVVVEEGAWNSKQIYLERVTVEEEAAATDSGWFIGRADGAPPGANNISMPIRDLLQSRQDLKEVMTLTPGHLVLLGETGVTAILDETGKDVWKGLK